MNIYILPDWNDENSIVIRAKNTVGERVFYKDMTMSHKTKFSLINNYRKEHNIIRNRKQTQESDSALPSAIQEKLLMDDNTLDEEIFQFILQEIMQQEFLNDLYTPGKAFSDLFTTTVCKNIFRMCGVDLCTGIEYCRQNTLKDDFDIYSMNLLCDVGYLTRSEKFGYQASDRHSLLKYVYDLWEYNDERRGDGDVQIYFCSLPSQVKSTLVIARAMTTAVERFYMRAYESNKDIDTIDVYVTPENAGMYKFKMKRVDYIPVFVAGV